MNLRRQEVRRIFTEARSRGKMLERSVARDRAQPDLFACSKTGPGMKMLRKAQGVPRSEGPTVALVLRVSSFHALFSFRTLVGSDAG